MMNNLEKSFDKADILLYYLDNAKMSALESEFLACVLDELASNLTREEFENLCDSCYSEWIK